MADVDISGAFESVALAESVNFSANNTTVRRGSFIQVLPDGVTDWTLYSGSDVNVCSDLASTGIKVKSISFTSDAANQYIEIREQGVDNALVWRNSISTAGDQTFRVDFGKGIWINPVIDASDCDWNIGSGGTAAGTRITFEIY